MNSAKIGLSPKELELVTNADWILTKNVIVKKAKGLLEELSLLQQHAFQVNNSFAREITEVPPKISKGENYRGLPYLVHDYPRYFNKENVFAIRTLFWWGNFFSITLHLSGRFKSDYTSRLLYYYNEISERDFYFVVNDSEWEHHFENDNYQHVGGREKEEWVEYFALKPFLKLAKKIPLEKWDEAILLLEEDYLSLVRWLGES